MDLDGDGVGECGTLGELSGLDPIRGRADGERLDPPLLSRGMQPTAPHGTTIRSGYCFRLFLPGRDGRWLRIDEAPAARDVDEAEVRWCAFAWPRRHGQGTQRTFRIDHTGRVTATAERLDASRLARVDATGWGEVR